MQVLRPRTTVRWRLTLLYSVLFLICGAALLAITYEFFIKFAFSYPPKAAAPNGSPANSSLAELDAALGRVRTAYLHRLLLGSGIALGIMAVVSAVLGWVVAGRVLAPLRTITATTERISATDLHERLAMPGPRDELRLLADTIDRLLARLEAAFDAQRRFVANASHELRTPLAMMRTTLDVAAVDPGGYLTAVSCPPVSLCLVGGNDGRNGEVLATTRPSDGAGAWRKTTIDPGMAYYPVTLDALSCASRALCVTGEDFGNILTSIDPTDGACAWTKSSFEPGGASLSTISCPSASLCVAADGQGNLVTSTDPAAGASTWTRRSPNGCTSTTITGTRAVDTAPPGQGNSIADVSLHGDSFILSWTHDATQRQLELH